MRATGPVQLRHQTPYTSKEYVTRKGWREASLERCPAHPHGGCHFHRNGTYPRVAPAGMRIARYYCPEAQATFSLLPDCLAGHLSGDLSAVEEVVARVERSRSIEAAADSLRPAEISLPSAVRWVWRRLIPVRAALLAIMTLMPEWFGGCAPSVLEARRVLCTQSALIALREVAAARLGSLPPPLGFGPRVSPRRKRRRGRQQETGPDPPGGRW
ncbi:MAG: hypothetical protein ACYC37_10590 [Desulfobacteria bacterium]